jgi:hypothetical protein
MQFSQLLVRGKLFVRLPFQNGLGVKEIVGWLYNQRFQNDIRQQLRPPLGVGSNNINTMQKVCSLE